MKNINRRIDWIDLVKGIGIFMVVLGHSGLSDQVAIIIYSFHMPLFFFLSGFLFKYNPKISFNAFLKSKASALLIPYFSFSFITYTYYIAKNHLSNESDYSLLKPFIGIFYSSGTDGWMEYNVALWFLTCLFVTEILFYVILKYFVNYKDIIFALIICSIIGYIGSMYEFVRFPWGINIAVSSVVFLGSGYLTRKYSVLNKINKYLTFTLALLIFSIFVFQMINLNYMIDMNNNDLFYYYNFYLPAFAGILLLILLSKHFYKNKLVLFFGRNSLIVLSLHLPILSTLSWLQVNYINISILNNYTLVNNLFLTFFTFIVLIPLINLINGYFPFILGKKNH